MNDRGSSLLEILVLGTAVVLLAVQALVSLGRLDAAGEAAAAAARAAATVTARTGDPARGAATARDLLPGGEVDVVERGGRVEAIATIPVTLVGPDGSGPSLAVTERVVVQIAPYRSGR